jgi:carnosine N-methyltransferase
VLNSQPIGFNNRLQAIEDAIDTNSNCALALLRTGLQWTGFGQLLSALDKPPSIVNNLPCLPGLQETTATFSDFAKASSTIRHLYREWSAEGATERSLCFTPLIDFLEKYYSAIPREKKHNIRVLNPGCGLGRFVFEVARAGYSAEGIEISYHMLFGSMHMLNSIESVEQHRIYPFVLGGSNHICDADRMRHVMVPDVCPRDVLGEASSQSEVPVPERLGISSGDFSTVFRQEATREAYEVLATIFFLDTAKNPLSYMEAAANCLKPGGLWMNLGPLKWHFEFEPEQHNLRNGAESSGAPPKRENSDHDHGIGEPGAVELAEEDILHLLDYYGFDVIHYEEAAQRPTGYIHDPRSMETTMFYCSFWVARKRTVSSP